MNNTKVTLKELIARKEAVIENNKKIKTMDFYIPSLDGVITIKEASRDVILDCSKMGDKSDIYVVYNCCVEPNLKDKELQEAYGCVEPMEIVNTLFKQGEATNIALKCLEMAGYGDDVITEIKN